MTGIEHLREFAKGCRLIGERVYSNAIADIADQIERERDAEVSDSPYDAILPEDREAIAWVREHGGLERVKNLLSWVVGHCSTKQQLDFDFWLSGRVMHELGFEEDMADRDEVERRLLARLMPEGYEWLRYDTGELVLLGGEVTVTVHDGDGDFDRTLAIRSIKYKESGVLLEGTKNEMVILTHGERVRRPEPKVLDADGAEIHEGDEVWVIGESEPGTVVYAYPPGDDGQPSVKVGATWHHAVDLTHRAPVLAADGEPLEVGQTVWHEDGTELKVLGFGDEEDSETIVRVEYVSGPTRWGEVRSLSITHAKPEPSDSWERIEEDADKSTCEYFEQSHGCGGCPHYPSECNNDKAQDLVRRCRALAERKVSCDIDCYIAETVMGHDFCETPCDGCLSRVFTYLADLIEPSCDRDTPQKVAEEMFGKMRHSTKEEADAYDAMLKSKSVEIHQVDRDALLALADEMEFDGAGALDNEDWCKPLLVEYARRIREALGVSE